MEIKNHQVEVVKYYDQKFRINGTMITVHWRFCPEIHCSPECKSGYPGPLVPQPITSSCAITSTAAPGPSPDSSPDSSPGGSSSSPDIDAILAKYP